MKVIDLFSGCGGLSFGFEQNGFTISKAVEFEKSIAETYKKNRPNVNVIVDDIKNIDTTGIFHQGDAEVIIGGPPCQGFSMAGARIRNGFIDDPRNYLFKHYFNVVKEVKPIAFVMENVKGIMTMQDGEIFNEIIRLFSSNDEFGGEPYHLFYEVVKAVEFGVPQKRERVILMGIRGKEVDFQSIWDEVIDEIKNENPHFFDKVTVRDAIANLGETTEDGVVPNPMPETYYQKSLASDNKTLTNHNGTKHSLTTVNRMKKVLNGQNYTVLDETINSVHSGAYGRLSWDEPAPTITTRFDTPAGGRFIHPVFDRTLTPREAARIQSFPDDFKFYGSKTSICKQIGNAVPPKVSYFLARVIKKAIESKV